MLTLASDHNNTNVMRLIFEFVFAFCTSFLFKKYSAVPARVYINTEPNKSDKNVIISDCTSSASIYIC